jgi:hypothetical protein
MTRKGSDLPPGNNTGSISYITGLYKFFSKRRHCTLKIKGSEADHSLLLARGLWIPLKTRQLYAIL